MTNKLETILKQTMLGLLFSIPIAGIIKDSVVYERRDIGDTRIWIDKTDSKHIVSAADNGESLSRTHWYDVDNDGRFDHMKQIFFSRVPLQVSATSEADPHLFESINRLSEKMKILNSYPSDFTDSETFTLSERNIDAETAKKYMDLNRKYNARITAKDILNYKEKNNSFEEVEKEARAAWVRRSVEKY